MCTWQRWLTRSDPFVPMWSQFRRTFNHHDIITFHLRGMSSPSSDFQLLAQFLSEGGNTPVHLEWRRVRKQSWTGQMEQRREVYPPTLCRLKLRSRDRIETHAQACPRFTRSTSLTSMTALNEWITTERKKAATKVDVDITSLYKLKHNLRRGNQWGIQASWHP